MFHVFEVVGTVDNKTVYMMLFSHRDKIACENYARDCKRKCVIAKEAIS